MPVSIIVGTNLPGRDRKEPKKRDAMEKQQHINKSPPRVNPTSFRSKAGILHERFDVVVHPNRMMETFGMYLQPVTVNTLHAVCNRFPSLFPHERAVAELQV